MKTLYILLLILSTVLFGHNAKNIQLSQVRTVSATPLDASYLSEDNKSNQENVENPLRIDRENDNQTSFSEIRDNTISKKFHRKHEKETSSLELKNTIEAKTNLKEKCKTAIKQVEDLLSKNEQDLNVNNNKNKKELFHFKQKLEVFLEQLKNSSNDSLNIEQQINDVTNKIKKYLEFNENEYKHSVPSFLSEENAADDTCENILAAAANKEDSINKAITDADDHLKKAQNMLSTSEPLKTKWENKLIDIEKASLKIKLINQIQEMKSKNQEIINSESVIQNQAKSAKRFHHLIQTLCKKTADSPDHANDSKNEPYQNAKTWLEKLESVNQEIQKYNQQIASTLNNMNSFPSTIKSLDQEIDAYLLEQQENNKTYQKQLEEAANKLFDENAQINNTLQNIQNSKMDIINIYNFTDFVTGIFKDAIIDAEKKNIKDEISHILFSDLTSYETNVQRTLDLITRVKKTIKQRASNSTLQKLLQEVEECNKTNANDKMATDSIIEKLKESKTIIDTLKKQYLDKMNESWSKNVAQMVQSVTATKKIITEKTKSVQQNIKKIDELIKEMDTLLTKYSADDAITSISSKSENKIFIDVNKIKSKTQLDLVELGEAVEQCENAGDDLKTANEYLNLLKTKIENDDSTKDYINKLQVLISAIQKENVSIYLEKVIADRNVFKKKITDEFTQLEIKENYITLLLTVNEVIYNSTTYKGFSSSEFDAYQKNLKNLKTIKEQISKHKSKHTADKTFDHNLHTLEPLMGSVNNNATSMKHVNTEFNRIAEAMKSFKSKISKNITADVAKKNWDSVRKELQKLHDMIYLFKQTKVSGDNLKTQVKVLELSYISNLKHFHRTRIITNLTKLKESAQSGVRVVESVKIDKMTEDYEIVKIKMNTDKEQFNGLVQKARKIIENMERNKNTLHEYIQKANGLINQIEAISSEGYDENTVSKLESKFSNIEDQYNQLLVNSKEAKKNVDDLHKEFYIRVTLCEWFISEEFRHQANESKKEKINVLFSEIQDAISHKNETLRRSVRTALPDKDADFNDAPLLQDANEKMELSTQTINVINNIYEQEKALKYKNSETEIAKSLQNKRKEMEEQLDLLNSYIAILNDDRNQINHMRQLLAETSANVIVQYATNHSEAATRHNQNLKNQLSRSEASISEAKTYYDKKDKLIKSSHNNKEEAAIDRNIEALKRYETNISQLLSVIMDAHNEATVLNVNVVTNCRYITRTKQKLDTLFRAQNSHNHADQQKQDQISKQESKCNEDAISSKENLAKISSHLSIIKGYYEEIKKDVNNVTLLLYKTKVANRTADIQNIYIQITGDMKNLESTYLQLNQKTDQAMKDLSNIYQNAASDKHKAKIFEEKINPSKKNLQEIQEYRKHMLEQTKALCSNAEKELKNAERYKDTSIKKQTTDIEDLRLLVDQVTYIKQTMENILLKFNTYKESEIGTNNIIEAEQHAAQEYLKVYDIYVLTNVVQSAKNVSIDIESTLKDMDNLTVKTTVFVRQYKLDNAVEEDNKLKKFSLKIEELSKKSTGTYEQILQIWENSKNKKKLLEIESDITNVRGKKKEMEQIESETDATLIEIQTFFQNIYKNRIESYHLSLQKTKEETDATRVEIDKNCSAAKRHFQIIHETEVMKAAVEELHISVDNKIKVTEEYLKYEKSVTRVNKLVSTLKNIDVEIKLANDSPEKKILDSLHNVQQTVVEAKQNIDDKVKTLEEGYMLAIQEVQKLGIKEEARKIYNRILVTKDNIESVMKSIYTAYDKTNGLNIEDSTKDNSLYKHNKTLSKLVTDISENRSQAKQVKTTSTETEKNDISRKKDELGYLENELSKKKNSATLENIKKTKNDAAKAQTELVSIFDKTIDMDINMTNIADTIKNKQLQYAQVIAADVYTNTSKNINNMGHILVQVNILTSQIEKEHEEINTDRHTFINNVEDSKEVVQNAANKKQKMQQIMEEALEHYNKVYTSFSLINNTNDEKILITEIKNLISISTKINDLKTEAEIILNSMIFFSVKHTDIYIINKDYIQVFTTNIAKQKMNSHESNELHHSIWKPLVDQCIIILENTKMLNDETSKKNYVRNPQLEASENERLLNEFKEHVSSISAFIEIFEDECQNLNKIYSTAIPSNKENES